MDAAEILVAAGELPAASVVRASGSSSTSAVNGSSSSAAPDVTDASVEPRVAFEAPISSL